MRLRFLVPIVFAAVPSIAAAQSAPADPTASPSAAAATPTLSTLVASGLATITAMVRAQQQARAAMLAALMPEHRALLGRLVGTLATADAPNADAAAQALDDALDPAELGAIVRIATEERRRLAAPFSAAGTPSISPEDARKMLDTIERSQSPQMQSQLAVAAQKSIQMSQDPGYILLRAAVAGTLPTPGFSK